MEKDVPFFCMTCRNLTTTLEDGRMMTCLFPLFSALEMVLRQSDSTDIFVILRSKEATGIG